MSLADILTGILSDDVDDPTGSDDRGSPEERSIVFECRECGVTVSEGTSRCPSCDAAAIAEYPIE